MKMNAIVTLETEVHAIPGETTTEGDREHFESDRKHELIPGCPCMPQIVWGSAAAPLPLYEHRDKDGLLNEERLKRKPLS